MTITKLIEHLEDAHGTADWFHLNSQVSCLEKMIVKWLVNYNTCSTTAKVDKMMSCISTYWDTTM